MLDCKARVPGFVCRSLSDPDPDKKQVPSPSKHNTNLPALPTSSPLPLRLSRAQPRPTQVGCLIPANHTLSHPPHFNTPTPEVHAQQQLRLAQRHLHNRRLWKCQ